MEKLRKIGSYLVLLSAIFFLLKYTIGLVIDVFIITYTIKLGSIILLLKISDLLLISVDILIIKRFFSFD